MRNRFRPPIPNWKLKLTMATFSHWQHYRHVILVGTTPPHLFHQCRVVTLALRTEELKNQMRSRCSLFGEPVDGANEQPVVAVVVVRNAATRIEVEAPRVVVVRARNGRPVVSARIQNGRPVAARCYTTTKARCFLFFTSASSA